MSQRQTHARRLVPVSYTKRDELPHLTPIIGDVICYETWAGDLLHADGAMIAMREGVSVYYTTWEIE